MDFISKLINFICIVIYFILTLLLIFIAMGMYNGTDSFNEFISGFTPLLLIYLLIVFAIHLRGFIFNKISDVINSFLELYK